MRVIATDTSIIYWRGLLIINMLDVAQQQTMAEKNPISEEGYLTFVLRVLNIGFKEVKVTV